MHEKWVLNEQGRKYFPYYYFAHSNNGKVEWCYIRKKRAKEIMASKKLQKLYQMEVAVKSVLGERRTKRGAKKQ
jgi:hypothetical protein